jgi:hypothetical protein
MEEIISFIDGLDGCSPSEHTPVMEARRSPGATRFLLRSRRRCTWSDSTFRHHRDQELPRRRKLRPRASWRVPRQHGRRQAGVHRSHWSGSSCHQPPGGRRCAWSRRAGCRDRAPGLRLVGVAGRHNPGPATAPEVRRLLEQGPEVRRLLEQAHHLARARYLRRN